MTALTPTFALASALLASSEVPADISSTKAQVAGILPHSHTHAGSEIDEKQTPVMLEVTYTSEVISNLSGGKIRRTRYLDNLDVVLEADLERLIGWSGAELHAYALYNNGASISGDVGDAFAVSNIEADGDHDIRLYEAWIAQQISPTASVKVGIYDLNSEFDSLDVSGLFTGSAHGIGVDFSQSGANGPSIFPNTSLAIRAEQNFHRGSKVRAAILDGVPADPARPGNTAIKLRREDGALAVVEFETPVENGKLLVGHWRYTAKFDTFAGIRSRGNAGFYLRGENKLGHIGGTRVDIFARLGTASGRHNMFNRFASAGFRLSGIFDTTDQLGLAFATAQTSKGYRISEGALRDETAFEVTYRNRVYSNIILQPTIQYIRNPSAAPMVNDALVIGIRSGLSFRF